jgi:Bacterial PH domain
MARPDTGLEDDEPLLLTMTVTFRGAIAANMRGLALASSRTRLRAFAAWATHAEAVGFPTSKPEMLIGVTDRRLIVWRPSFWFGRPVEVVGTVPYDQLAQVEVYRQGLAVSLTFGFRSGEFVEVESMRARRMRRIRDAIRARLSPT